MWCVCEFDILTRRLTAERSSGRSVLCTSNKYECAMNGVFIFVRAYTNEGISCIINSTEYDKHELRTENHTAFSLYWSFRWKRSTHKHRNFAYVNSMRISNLMSEFKYRHMDDSMTNVLLQTKIDESCWEFWISSNLFSLKQNNWKGSTH